MTDSDFAFLDTRATVECPHCGETSAIDVDPTGGARQDYVQDCEVCCRPWHVAVVVCRGAVEVSVTAEVS